MSSKDYTTWHRTKQALNDQSVVPYFSQQEIWWVTIGQNIGYEEDGKGTSFSRPVLILRKFNYYFFLGLPLSTTSNSGRYYYSLRTTGRSDTILLSQIRAFDARRLINRNGYVPRHEFAMIKRKLINLL